MKFILLLTFITGSLFCNAQSTTRTKLDGLRYQTVYKDKTGEFSFATDFRDTAFVLVLNQETKKLTFYGEKTESYDLTKEPEKYDEGRFKALKWSSCLDKKSILCNVRLHIGKTRFEDDQSIRGFLYVDYKDRTFVYVIKLVED